MPCCTIRPATTCWRSTRPCKSLAREDPAGAELVRLRAFAGLTLAEAAEVMGIGRRTADRYWAYARAWLCDALGDNKPTAEPSARKNLDSHWRNSGQKRSIEGRGSK